MKHKKSSTKKAATKKVTLVKKSTGEKTKVEVKPKVEAPKIPTLKTKHNMVKSHLIKKKHITSWDAILMYKATRLSAIIFNLRKEGYKITTHPISSKDANGNSVTYAKYLLVSEPNKK